MSSADGERGAPPMVAGHTFMGSPMCIATSQLVADKWVFDRGAVQLLHQNAEKVHSRKK